MIEQMLTGAKIVFSAAFLTVIFVVSVLCIDHWTEWIRVTARIVLALFIIFILLFISYGVGTMVME